MLQHAKMEKLMQRVVPENILLDKTTYDKMGTVLREFAVQEMKHAANIIERIYYLGGDATTKSEKPALGNSLNEFAKLGIKAEEEALVLYRKVIEEAAKLGDWETENCLKKSTPAKRLTSSGSKNTWTSKMKPQQKRCLLLSGAKSSPTITSSCSTKLLQVKSRQ
jgi:rubrerythrin